MKNGARSFARRWVGGAVLGVLGALGILGVLTASATPARATDDRQLVAFPEEAQDRLLANMRDYLAAFNDALSLLASGEAEGAAWTIEERIGVTSLSAKDIADLAPHMPETMRQLWEELPRSASRFAKVLWNADTDSAGDEPVKVYAALQEIVTVCTTCHYMYRTR